MDKEANHFSVYPPLQTNVVNGGFTGYTWPEPNQPDAWLIPITRPLPILDLPKQERKPDGSVSLHGDGLAIVKDHNTVSGVSSAASIWNTGAIGLAVAFDRFEIAILLAILNFITLSFFGKVKETVDQREASNE